MPGPISTTPPFGVQDNLGARALGVITTNTRVKGAQGMMATQLDVLIFPGVIEPASVIGMWTVSNSRVQIAGVRTIGATSQGLAITYSAVGAPKPNGPLIVSEPDKRISNT